MKIFTKAILPAVATVAITVALASCYFDSKGNSKEAGEPVDVWRTAVGGLRDVFAMLGIAGLIYLCVNGRRDKGIKSYETKRRLEGKEEQVLCDMAELSDELLDVVFSSNSEARQSVEYTIDRVDEILLKHGATAIDKCMRYDPMLHRAIPAGVLEKGAVITDTLRCGWMLNDRVIRRARVKMAE